MSLFSPSLCCGPTQDRDGEPVVSKLTSEPIQIRDDHFSQPPGRGHPARGPLHFPVPEIRYLVKEISMVWHLYGGKDFGGGQFTSSPAKSRGCVVAQTPAVFISVSLRRRLNVPIISGAPPTAPPRRRRRGWPTPAAAREGAARGTQTC